MFRYVLFTLKEKLITFKNLGDKFSYEPPLQ